MGCRTGFYVIFAGDLKSEDIIGVLREAADYVLNYDDNTPILDIHQETVVIIWITILSLRRYI